MPGLPNPENNLLHLPFATRAIAGALLFAAPVLPVHAQNQGGGQGGADSDDIPPDVGRLDDDSSYDLLLPDPDPGPPHGSDHPGRSFVVPLSRAQDQSPPETPKTLVEWLSERVGPHTGPAFKAAIDRLEREPERYVEAFHDVLWEGTDPTLLHRPDDERRRPTRRAAGAVHLLHRLGPEHAESLLEDFYRRVTDVRRRVVRQETQEAERESRRYVGLRHSVLTAAQVADTPVLVDEVLSSVEEGNDLNPITAIGYVSIFAARDPELLDRLRKAVTRGGYQRHGGAVIMAALKAAKAEAGTLRPWQAILSFEVTERAAAASQLREIQEGVRESISHYLLFAAPSQESPPSTRLLLIRTAGEWRVSEAIPALLQLIEWPRPRHEPAGDHLDSPDAHYPAARALARIGGREVVEATFENIARPVHENEPDPRHERTLRPSAWVLREVLGQDLALAAIEIEKSKTNDPDIRHALDRMHEWIDQGGDILPPVGDQGPP